MCMGTCSNATCCALGCIAVRGTVHGCLLLKVLLHCSLPSCIVARECLLHSDQLLLVPGYALCSSAMVSARLQQEISCLRQVTERMPSWFELHESSPHCTIIMRACGTLQWCMEPMMLHAVVHRVHYTACSSAQSCVVTCSGPWSEGNDA